MSALAQVLSDMGYEVQGSDIETTLFTQQPLEKRDIPIFTFDEQNIKDDLCVIAGNAFNENHVEIKQSLERKLPFYRYHTFLGELSKGFTSIAVTGAHGKTSTTGLLSHVLSGLRPTSYLIGDGTGKGESNSDYFVFESCEYKRHFLAYYPDYAIVTNIDFDHPDYFKNIDDVVDAFTQFLSQIGRQAVVCGDDSYIRTLQTPTPMLYYGFDDLNDVQAKNIRTDGSGTSFDLFLHGEQIESIHIPLFGKHNVLNTLAVLGICILEHLPLQLVKEQLVSFNGVKRRFTEKKVSSNIMIDDYAHHPAEITATIEAVRMKYPDKRLITIFQPHTYSRTRAFINEFSMALQLSDEVYLCDIFGSARENDGDLSIADLLNMIPSSQFISEENIDKLQQYSDAVLLFMGAGDIQKLQRAFEATYVF